MQALKNLRRYLEIIWSVLRLRGTVRIQRLRAWLHNRFGIGPPVEVDSALALRQMIERLGGTFIKFGQIMAMRPDLLPAKTIETLSGLLDRVPSFPGAQAKAIVEAEFGRPVEEVFSDFSETPLAAASFAQVHRATLKSGEAVVVKVQRPNLHNTIAADLRFIQLLASLVDILGVLRQIRLRPIVADFMDWTLDELDYIKEATFGERMRQASATNPFEYIPRIYWDYVTPRILVQEFLDGVWVSDLLDAVNRKDQSKLAGYLQRGIDLKLAAYNIFQAGLHQAFEEELFHADPHAANIAILPGNIPGYIDFGITGELSEQFRATQLVLLECLQRGNVDQFVHELFRLFYPPPVTTNVEELEERLRQNVRRWLNNGYNPRATLHERSSAYLLTRNFALAREYGLSYAVIGVRFYRALLVAELIVLQLDPEFDTRANIRRFFVRQGFHAIGKDREPVNFAMRLMDNRLVFRNLPEATRSLFNLADREMSSVRTSVSTALVTLANVCRVVAALGLVFLIAAVAASIAAEVDSSKSWAIESLAQFSWSLYFWLGVFGVLFFFVLGRILDRRSVTRGSYIRRSG